MRTVDLFLGGPLGLWVLDNVDPRTVGYVFTVDKAVSEKARDMGIKLVRGAHEHLAPVALSVHYPIIIKPYAIDLYENIYNIHPGYLPWGRCYYPVFWSLWADEPAGCTLHEIDEGIDTGPIVAQRKVPRYDWDTGGSLHKRVSEAEKGLFLEYWPRILAGDLPAAIPQPAGGSFHLKVEFLELKASGRHLVRDEHVLLKLIRCLSHPDYSGMLYSIGGRQYEISARLVR